MIPLYINLENFSVVMFGFGNVGQRRFNKILKGNPKKITIYDKNSIDNINNINNINNKEINNKINNKTNNTNTIVKYIQKDISTLTNKQLEEIIKNYNIIITSINKENNERIVNISNKLNKLVNSSTYEKNINIVIPACCYSNGVYFSIYTKGKSPIIAREIRKIVENYLTNNNIFIMENLRNNLKDVKNQQFRKDIYEELYNNKEFKEEFDKLVKKYTHI